MNRRIWPLTYNTLKDMLFIKSTTAIHPIIWDRHIREHWNDNSYCRGFAFRNDILLNQIPCKLIEVDLNEIH
jgi:hypothetical protein